MEPRTRISRGFAFVTMGLVEDADRCIKYLNQSVLEGRCITVEKVIYFSTLGWRRVFDWFSFLFDLRVLVTFRMHCINYIGSNPR